MEGQHWFMLVAAVVVGFIIARTQFGMGIAGKVGL
jgi:hypothetical protein